MYLFFSPVWIGDGEYGFGAFDRQMEMFQRFASDGYFNVMIQLGTSDWWLAKGPDVPNSFRNLNRAMVSEAWKRDAAKRAGVHLYCEDGSVLYASARLVAHCAPPARKRARYACRAARAGARRSPANAIAPWTACSNTMPEGQTALFVLDGADE